MLRLLADENFNGDIVRGLFLQYPELDLLRMQDVGLLGADDQEILSWAAVNDRVVLSHDFATMAWIAYERVAGGGFLPGVFLIDDRFPVGLAIREILLVNECSEQSEWNGKVVSPLVTVDGAYFRFNALPTSLANSCCNSSGERPTISSKTCRRSSAETLVSGTSPE
jgi:hypothetical protein